MIKPYSRVILNINIPDSGLIIGDVGVIVDIHEKGKGYEIEFFALDGTTISVETLAANEIRQATSREILHTRELV